MKFFKRRSKKEIFGLAFGLTLSLILFSILFYKEYSLKDNVKTCAKFVRYYEGKSSSYYVFEYFIGDVAFQGSRGGSVMKMRNLDSLKQIDCIEIIYSKSDRTNIRIVDKRVADEWIDWSK